MVDLPAPFSPVSPRISPWERSIDTSFKAFTPGKDFDMPRISRSLEGTTDSFRNSPTVRARAVLAGVLMRNLSMLGRYHPTSESRERFVAFLLALSDSDTKRAEEQGSELTHQRCPRNRDRCLT